jgi:uncharacterized damage-inducible protein DinB
MSFHKKRSFALSIVGWFISINISFGQQPPAFSSAVERQFNKIENDIVSTAEAMPENKFYFTPENLQIKNADFKGVRTFAGQIMHLATDNILIWSSITGDSVRADITDVNGTASIKTKADILKYLKSSFAVGRKAMSMLTEKNAMEMIPFRGRNLPRLDLVFYALTHANEHYGQMAVYVRMCGIVPPPTLSDR